MEDQDQGDTATETNVSRSIASRRDCAPGSFAQELVSGLGEVDFGDRIIIFGASLLLSVLPLIIVLSAYASYRIQEDIAQHLGLSHQGSKIVEGLFHASITSCNLAILVSLLLSFAGTIAVARSVQVIYEQAFEQPHATGMSGLLRSLVWMIATGGIAIGDSAIGKAVRDDAGPVLMGLLEFVGFTLFFWWSIHFLLDGRVSWRRTRPAAIASAVCWSAWGPLRRSTSPRLSSPIVRPMAPSVSRSRL